MDKEIYEFELSKNAEGGILATAGVKGDDSAYRIAGPKAWGGSSTIGKVDISQRDLVEFVLCYAPGAYAEIIAYDASLAAPQVVADERAQNNPQAHTWPAEIWLQVGDCDNGAEMTYDAAMRHEVTWCAESIDRNDVRYVRASAPVQAQEPVIEMLLNVVRLAYDAMDNTEENEHGLQWDRNSFGALSSAMDDLERLPDDQPGYVMGPAAKAEWALRDRAPVQPAAVPDDWQMMPKKLTLPMAHVLDFGRTQPTQNTYLNLLAVAPTAPAAQGDAKTTTKQVCANCGGEGRFYKTAMSDFGSGEREETVCKVCVGSGVVYSAITAKAIS